MPRNFKLSTFSISTPFIEYYVIPCTSLGIVPVHYTFMYMDEREQQIGENTDIVDFSL